MPNAGHRWLAGGRRADRDRLVAALDLPPLLLPPVDAHRRLRGPYTAAGTVLRAVVPEALAASPALVAAHDIEILSVAPELRGTVPASRETLTSLAVPGERTRFYSRMRTLRIAHGLVEFLRDHLRARGGPVALVVDDIDLADPTDRELLAVMVRRLDPDLLTAVVGSNAEQVPDPLGQALDRYAERVTVAAAPPERPEGDDDRLAAVYVDSDGTCDLPAVAAAYQRLDPARRARLHDARADLLEARGEWSLSLGAIAYHREHGSDPGGAGAKALQTALDYCIDLGFYDATVDFAARGRAIVDWRVQADYWWIFTTKMTTSLAALARPEEAEALYDEARAFTAEPAVHRQAAYATAMLYTRHHLPERRDDRLARAWINAAIALSALLPDAKERAFQTVFNENGLALIEVHRGDLPAALELVSRGLRRLDEELGEGEHKLHRSVLRYNRAQVHAALGRLDEAVADYTAVIEEDPNYAEYHFDRGNVLRRLGRDEEALADYERAMALSPPYPEVYYNRGDLRLEWGDAQGALADFDYVLELDPQYLDALVNRGGLLCELGRLAEARRDVDAGLALDPDNAHLLCVRARIAMEEGRLEDAWADFTRALDRDSTLVAAWANRGALAFERADIGGAVRDLTEALRLADDPVIRFNRALAHATDGRFGEAVEDLTAALSLGGDEAEIRLRRGEYLVRSGRREQAREDFDRCLAANPALADEVARLLPAPATH